MPCRSFNTSFLSLAPLENSGRVGARALVFGARAAATRAAGLTEIDLTTVECISPASTVFQWASGCPT